MMMAEEMARRRNRVARNVNLTHPPRIRARYVRGSICESRRRAG